MNERELDAHAAWDRGDLTAAFGLFKTAAVDEACAGAMLGLGYFYDEGLGCARSKSSAMHWYGKAFAAGEVCAATNIAILHRERRDFTRMLRWLRRACAAGDGDAEVDLARCHLSGLGTPKSVARARMHLRRAVRSGRITQEGKESALSLLEQLA